MVVSVAQAQGSVGGGRLEQRAIEIARERLVADAPTPHLERFVLGASLGQCCGGVVVLAFEHVGPAQRKWVERAAALAAAGRAWGRLVLIDGPRAGEVAVFDSASLESTCAPPLAAHAHRLLAAGADTALLVPAPCRSGARREPAAEPATAPGSVAAHDPGADSRLAALLHQDIAAPWSPDEDIAAPCRSGARREPAAEPATTPGSVAAHDPGADSRRAALLHHDIAARGSPPEDIAAACRSGARREPAAEPATTPGSAAAHDPGADSRLAALLHQDIAARGSPDEDIAAPCRSGARRESAAEPATAPGSAAARDPSADSRLAALLHQDIAARWSPPEDIAAPCRSGARRKSATEPASTPALAARCESACETAILLDASPQPALQVMMFGAGHVGRALAELFGRLPLRVRWIDERAGEFPPTVATNIETRCTDDPTAEVREAPAGAVFLVLTHSHALDFELVEAILARDDLRFCGLIGSQTKRMRFVHRLRARGVEEARVARLRCPVGLPGLPGKEAEVIALAIAAEVMRLRPREDPAATSRWPEAESEAAQPTASGQER
ncbi:MAG: xanthine dehydrogenase accessory protein XdhC [Thauera sp.]|nr:xanthine dehydrogenase accessory protein XdhC [Thauera sp.]